jgi:hypothetical protein
MRLRLGLLQDPAAIERQIQRELREAEKKRIKDATPTVKTEAETKAEEDARKKERKEVEDHVKAAHKPPRIRPLSENKAIETGANFIAETFLFLVAGGLILAESWRRDRKEKKQDADVADALATAEKEREEVKEKLELLQAEIEALMDKKPFDSVRAAAAASIRHIPSTKSGPTASKEDTTASVSGFTPTVPATTSAAAEETSATKAVPKTSISQGVTKTPATEGSDAPAGQTAAQPSATSGPSTRLTTDGTRESSSLSSWFPSSWLGGGGAKPSTS